MTNLIIIAVVAGIIAVAAGYVYREKKRGARCIGCPGGCISCGCCGSRNDDSR